MKAKEADNDERGKTGGVKQTNQTAATMSAAAIADTSSNKNGAYELLSSTAPEELEMRQPAGAAKAPAANNLSNYAHNGAQQQQHRATNGWQALHAEHTAELLPPTMITTPTATAATHLAKIQWWNTPPQPWQFNEFAAPRATNNNGNTTAATAAAAAVVTTTTKSARTPTKSAVRTPNKSARSPGRTAPTTPLGKKPTLPAARPAAAPDDGDDLENFSQKSQLLAEHAEVGAHHLHTGLLNAGEEDEMAVTGYRHCLWRTILCWLCICLTAGILRLVMHWWRHWYLIATHQPCQLASAEKLLIEENYQGKHKVFYVKSVQTVTIDDLKAAATSDTPIDDKATHLSLHFTSAQFITSQSVRLFNCKQLRYAWDNQSRTFQKLKGLDENINSFYYHKQRGLAPPEQLSRRLVYGPNEISVPYKDVKTLLFLEVLNPFYVFQIFSVILWFTYDYYYYACVIVLMSVFGVSMSIIQTKKNQDALRATVQNTGSALVLNAHGVATELPTERLVPGDIIEIPTTGCIMQCDAVLLSGNCIVDEAMLTGESVPVTKTPLPKKRDVIYDKKEHARHTLFCGTKVIQTRYFGSEKVLAIVTNTGNITAKGGLVRSILYPPPVDYKFEQDSYKFIECLALIALIGFTYTLVSKIMRNVPGWKIAIESLDLITIVVPPALPAAMSVGRFYAQRRLERQSIYCISPRSINVAGSIDCCCFDKTGTLTEDGLDMWGVVPKSVTNEFQIPIRQIERLPADSFLFGMVTCHAITIMDGKRVGDPLDLKMFESTGWLMEDANGVEDSQKYGLLHPTIVRQPKHLKVDADMNNAAVNTGAGDEAAAPVTPRQRQSSVDDLLSDVGLLDGQAQNDHGIVREFPFTSGLQRMSVITRRLSEKNFTVYCKGSPEMLQQLCRPQTLPANYTQQLALYAKQGYRIIALACKPFNRKVNYTKVQRLTREIVECDLEFLGFVIMENRLKPDTTKVIQSLNTANIRTVMVTGDNILTALSVARDCGIVNAAQAVVTVHVRRSSAHGDGAVDDQTPLKSTARSMGGGGALKSPTYELYYTLEPGSSAPTTVETVGPMANGNAVRSGGGYSSVNGGLSTLASSKSYAEFGDSGGNSTIMTTLPYSNSLCSVEEIAIDKDDGASTNGSTVSTDIELGKRHLAATASNNNSKGIAAATAAATTWRHNYRFAMTGETWQLVREHFPHELTYFVTRGAIFARMSPEAKQNLIMELQQLGYCVAMCGDGANDCGALKVAHTGISLSETEASIASPFTSCSPTIACVPNVIKEGRAALVTSFGIFKYMAAYSLVQFISVMILYSIDSNLTDKQYLYIDLGLISVFAFFFGKTAAYEGPLHKRVPLSSLISLMPLASLVLHLLVVIAFQVAGWYQLHGEDWFVPFTFSSEEHMGCHENYTMFAISSFQYIILAFVFSKGAPYRKPIWSNIPFCLSLLINLAVVVYLVTYPPHWLAEFFQLILPPVMSFRYWMLAYGLVAFVMHCLVEMVIVELLLFKVTTKRERNQLKYAQVNNELNFFHNWPPIEEVLPSPPRQHESSGAHVAAVANALQVTAATAPAAESATGGALLSGDDMFEVSKTPTYVELSVQQNFDITTPTPTGLNSFFT